MNDRGRFDGRVVIATGSSSGIGEAAVRLFSEPGAHVVGNSLTSREAGIEVANSLANGFNVPADVSDADLIHFNWASLHSKGVLPVR